MPATLKLVQWEWFRLCRRGPFIALAALSFVVPILVLGVKIAQEQDWIINLGRSGYLEAVAGSTSFVAPLLAIVLASFIHAADLQNGNCRTLTSRGHSRDGILASKALLGVILLLGFHLSVLALAVITSIFLDPHFRGWQSGLETTAVSFLSALLYLSLGILLAHWRQSTAFTVGVGLALVFAETILYPIANGLGELFEWPAQELTAWTLWGITQGLQGNGEYFGPLWYLPLALGYMAALAGLAVLVFRKLDLRAGSE